MVGDVRMADRPRVAHDGLDRLGLSKEVDGLVDEVGAEVEGVAGPWRGCVLPRPGTGVERILEAVKVRLPTSARGAEGRR